LAAWRHLKRCPGAYETVRQILGHRSIDTTIAYYTGLEAEFAAIDFDAAVLAERRATRALATNAFRRRNPTSAGGGAS
jgi:hypothetical protein